MWLLEEFPQGFHVITYLMELLPTVPCLAGLTRLMTLSCCVSHCMKKVLGVVAQLVVEVVAMNLLLKLLP